MVILERERAVCVCVCVCCFFVQAEDGIRDLVRSRGLGDVYKRQVGERCRVRDQEVGLDDRVCAQHHVKRRRTNAQGLRTCLPEANRQLKTCLLYTSDAADERSSVDLGGRRIIKKKKE